MNNVSFPKLGINIEVNRVAFKIGGFEVYWYGILIALGFLLAFIYVMKNARKFGINSDKLLDAVIIGAIFGVIGARLYYVVFAPAGEFTSFADVLNMRKGGMAFYGAVIFGFGSGVLGCLLRKVKILPALDIVSIGFLIGQGVGRWGNFVNQEAFGSNTSLPWGMTSESVVSYLTRSAADLAEKGIVVDPTMPVHPTFLYESLWCLLGIIVLVALSSRRKFDGEIFLMYLAWNGVGRAVIEGLRTDSLYIGRLRISQVLAIAGAIAAIAVIIVIRRKIKRSGDEKCLMTYVKTEAWQA
ncbi:MAG: prolipoprotein diacylglyceryl transferase, partial [Oscillospiraceae bacterium]